MKMHPEVFARLTTGGLLGALCGGVLLAWAGLGWCALVWFVAVLAVAATASARLLFWFPRGWSRRPTVLMLHSINPEIVDPNAANNSLEPERLEQLIMDLQAAGYTFRTLRGAMEGEPTRRTIVLTLDDGYVDNYIYLFPVLKRFGVPVTIFTTNRKGEQFLTEEQLRVMADSGLVELGGHTASHQLLPVCDGALLREELETNRAFLATILGAPPTSFAYPWGKYGLREREAVVAVGYRYAVTTWKRATGAMRNDPLQIPRRILPRGASRLALYWIATRGNVHW